MGLFGLFLLLALPLSNVRSDESSPAPQTIESPNLSVLERPGKSYQVGETILYKIKVEWIHAPSGIRMNPPDLDLENTELLNVGQEAVSELQNQDIGSATQILTFRFISKKPGPAKIKRFLLAWTQGEGAMSTSLAIPQAEWQVTPAFGKQFPVIYLGSAVAAGILLGIFFILKKRKGKSTGTFSTQISEDDVILEKLRALCQIWETRSNHKDFLTELGKTFEQYLSQKLDWNPSHSGYNALQKKIEAKWSKKEARELSELLQNIEFQQFSGTALNRSELSSLYKSIYSFVERKRVIETRKEATWKQPLNK